MPSTERSLPQYSPTPQELDDVELLRMGALAPLTGFEGADGEVTLTIPRRVAQWAIESGGLEIVDPEGVPLAILTMQDTCDTTADEVVAVGPLRPLPGTIRRAFGDLYVPPSETKAALDPSTLTVPVDAALTQSDLDAITKAADGNPVLLLAMVGNGSPRGMSPHGLIRATVAASRLLDGCQVAAIPVAARRDATTNVAFRRRVVDAYSPGESTLWVDFLGERPPEIQMIVEQDRPSGPDQGLVVFFTGLSGSGKSTIAQALRNALLEHGVRTVSLLDGDRVRRNLSAGLTFSREDRETNIARIGWVAAEIGCHGGMAICSPIAPFDETRKAARRLAEETGSAFFLIHVSTPLEECERRDRKGLYAKARRGEVEHFTGISSPYEVPDDADLTIDTTGRSISEVNNMVIELLLDHGLINLVTTARVSD